MVEITDAWRSGAAELASNPAKPPYPIVPFRGPFEYARTKPFAIFRSSRSLFDAIHGSGSKSLPGASAYSSPGGSYDGRLNFWGACLSDIVQPTASGC